MRAKFLCISDDAGAYDGKKGHTVYQQLALLDQDPTPESRLVNTLDYRMSEPEKALYAGKCLGKVVTLDVKDLAFFNSRLQVKTGRIVEVDGLKGR